MVDIENWMGELAEKLTGRFGPRLLFLGLQGSYGRGEAGEDSDIDVAAVLDRVELADLDAYRAVVRQMPEGEKACGFLCGARELKSWPKYDLCQLARDTRDVYGRLKPLLPPLGREDLAQAAAIGAGVQGACGDIFITGTARIVKAGGIGACPLGGCGRVTVSGGADIGEARIVTQADVPPEEEMPPRLRLTLEGLGLDRLRVRTLEEAQRAVPGVDKALRRLAALRRVYGEVYARAERSGSLEIWPTAGEPVRDTGAAGELLDGLKRSAPQAVKAHGRPDEAGQLL